LAAEAHFKVGELGTWVVRRRRGRRGRDRRALKRSSGSLSGLAAVLDAGNSDPEVSRDTLARVPDVVGDSSSIHVSS
jgi:hypothetical protein